MGHRQRANAKKKAAAKAARKAAGVVPDFNPRVLATKESRLKIRRWTFDLTITRMVPVEPPAPEPSTMTVTTADTSATPNTVDITGSNLPEAVTTEAKAEPKMEQKTFRFKTDHVLVGTVKDAEATAADIAKDYEQTGGQVKVVSHPHETVSIAVYRQLKGYQDMNNILQTAYEMAIKDLAMEQSVLLETDEDYSKKLDEAVGKLKNDYYKVAVESLRPKPAEQPVAEAQPEPQEEKIDLEKLRAAAYDPPAEQDQALATIP